MGLQDTFFVEWDTSYSVGVAAIDQQHRFLIGRIRDLQEAMAAGSAGAMLAPLIHNLITYTKFHFAYEEQLYAQRGYADLQRHKEFHSDMARQVVEMGNSLKTSKPQARAPVMAFLKHWLVDHILGEDMVAFGKKEPAQAGPNPRRVPAEKALPVEQP
jgi:hemerythrin-like metal-binding protein